MCERKRKLKFGSCGEKPSDLIEFFLIFVFCFSNSFFPCFSSFFSFSSFFVYAFFSLSFLLFFSFVFFLSSFFLLSHFSLAAFLLLSFFLFLTLLSFFSFFFTFLFLSSCFLLLILIRNFLFFFRSLLLFLFLFFLMKTENELFFFLPSSLLPFNQNNVCIFSNARPIIEVICFCYVVFPRILCLQFEQLGPWKGIRSAISAKIFYIWLHRYDTLILKFEISHSQIYLVADSCSGTFLFSQHPLATIRRGS